jgi:hypothetical protein
MIIEAGMKIVELEFPDGSNPPKAVIKQWLKIVQNQFGSPEELKKQTELNNKRDEDALSSQSQKQTKGSLK